MKREIHLHFDKATTRLAGYPYGQREYDRQVKEKMNFSAVNIIIFPDQIEKIASSFIQGFFAEIINKVGYEKFDDIVQIKAKDDVLANNIRNDLFV